MRDDADGALIIGGLRGDFDAEGDDAIAAKQRARPLPLVEPAMDGAPNAEQCREARLRITVTPVLDGTLITVAPLAKGGHIAVCEPMPPSLAAILNQRNHAILQPERPRHSKIPKTK